jgi:hypothetical protein
VFGYDGDVFSWLVKDSTDAERNSGKMESAGEQRERGLDSRSVGGGRSLKIFAQDWSPTSEAEAWWLWLMSSVIGFPAALTSSPLYRPQRQAMRKRNGNVMEMIHPRSLFGVTLARH